MHTTRLYLGLVVLGLVICGCASKPTHEALTAKMIGKMQEMVKTLQSAKDEPSAGAAATKYMKLVEEVKQLKEQAVALGKPTREQERALKTKYDQQMKQILLDIIKESFRLAGDPKLHQYFKNAAPPNIN